MDCFERGIPHRQKRPRPDLSERAPAPQDATPEAKDVVLAIDQGTTGTTVLAVNRQLEVIAKRTVEVSPTYPKPGWVEHDLEAIWRSTVQSLARVLEDGVDGNRIAAIGITNQRETVGLWERATGRPLAPAIVWQCRRTADRTRALADEGLEPYIQQKTGLLLDPYFSATKAEWLLDHVPGARARAAGGELAVGTIDAFLVHRLSGGEALATDPSNASRTMLFNLSTGAWDPELCERFRVPMAVLPEIRSSSEVVGETRGVPGLPDGVPIAGIAGDQTAALFGQACFEPGDAKCTYGTGAFLLTHTGTSPKRSKERLLTTVSWRLGPEAPLEYALEGSVFCAGAAVQWLRDGLQLVSSTSEIEPLARTVENSGEVVFVPALTGLGAPHWRPDARGFLGGLTRDTRPGHVARATLEGIALQCADVLAALERDAGQINTLKVDGGASANDLLLELQANLADKTVVRPSVIETTGAGAAFLAGLAVGVFDSKDAIAQAWRADRVFEPGDRSRVPALRAKWDRAIERA